MRRMFDIAATYPALPVPLICIAFLTFLVWLSVAASSGRGPWAWHQRWSGGELSRATRYRVAALLALLMGVFPTIMLCFWANAEWSSRTARRTGAFLVADGAVEGLRW